MLLVSLSYGQITDSSEIMVNFIEEPPFFKGDLKEFIQSEIDYPLSAKNDSIQGTVIVSFKIDTLGFTFEHKVVKGVREDLNNESLRVTKLIKFESPALQKGKPIPVKYVLPVVFKLDYTKKKEK